MTATTTRKQLLRSLVELERPLDDLVRELSRLGWDCDRELVTLQRQHVLSILERFKQGELLAQQVEAWANAVEAREDIAIESVAHSVLTSAVFELANPALHGALTKELADQWILRLRQTPGSE